MAKPLECRISTAMVRSRLDDKKFLPNTKLPELITKSEVTSQIGSSSDLVNYICDHATRVFAIVVLVRVARSPEELGTIMEEFRKHDFDDDRLPISEYLSDDADDDMEERLEEPDRPTCKTVEHALCNHLPHLDAFHNRFWSLASVGDFYTAQWRFSAPVFCKDQLKHDLYPHDILPFTSVSHSARDGHFSTVFKVKIHSDHQQVLVKVSDLEW